VKGWCSWSLTLIGVSGSTLIGLNSIITLIQTLNPTSDSNSIITSQVPSGSISARSQSFHMLSDSRLLIQPRITSPDLQRAIIPR
jgi:hypothetical protein